MGFRLVFVLFCYLCVAMMSIQPLNESSPSNVIIVIQYVKACVQGTYRKDTMQIELTMKHTGQGMHEVKRRFGIQQLLSSISH